MLRSWNFPPGDYRELLELLTFTLGGTIRRKLLRGVKTKLPGAYDHVRFMAKAIYYIKMFLFLPQLIDYNQVDQVEVSIISRMSKFVILLYGKYFFRNRIDIISSTNRSLILAKCNKV